jgi:hypothetical protein
MHMNVPSPSNQARTKARRWNAAHSAARPRHPLRVARGGMFGSSCSLQPPSASAKLIKSVSGACALGGPQRLANGVQAQVLAEYGHAEQSGLQVGVYVTSLPSVTRALPNPSLERTSTGKAPWPRGFHAYHPPRGQATSPVPAAQLKR